MNQPQEAKPFDHSEDFSFEVVADTGGVVEIVDGAKEMDKAKNAIRNHAEEISSTEPGEIIAQLAYLILNGPDMFMYFSPIEVIQIAIGENLTDVIDSNDFKHYLHVIRSAMEGIAVLDNKT